MLENVWALELFFSYKSLDESRRVSIALEIVY